VVDFGTFREGKTQRVFKHPVHEVLYGWDKENDKPRVPMLKKNIKYFKDIPAFRWIHLPANNVRLNRKTSWQLVTSNII
jgi:hypothetical protein